MLETYKSVENKIEATQFVGSDVQLKGYRIEKFTSDIGNVIYMCQTNPTKDKKTPIQINDYMIVDEDEKIKIVQETKFEEEYQVVE